MFYLLTQFAMFSMSKGTFHRNRCTFKKKFKIPYFLFLQCALSDFFYLYIKVCVLPIHTVNNFFFFPRYLHVYLLKNKVHFQNEYKITYFHVLQCAQSDFSIFISKLKFLILKQLTMFSFSKGTYQRDLCTFKN